MKTLSKGFLVLLCCALAPLMDARAQTQCSDGNDNDGDGRVDAYVELDALNGQVYQLGGTGNPEVVRSAVENAIRSKKFSLTPPITGAGSALVRSDGGNWANTGQDQGTGITEHLPTLQTVCRVLGYRDYVSSTCRDDERSWRYPYGKCNYHSPSDNYHWRFNGSNLELESANPKYGKTWIASISCKNRLSACSDGWDNDGDGAVDLADSGCRNANDDSEFMEDPKCTTPSGFTEFEQCRNDTDDDADGLTDAADPGCRTNPTVPASYDPNLDNEARATSQCQDGVDNDGDGAIDLADFSCGGSKLNNDETNPKSQCQDGIDNDGDGAIDLADFSCRGNKQQNDEANPKSKCQDGIDNDNDGAADLADFSCGGNSQRDDETNPKSQCQDGVDNDSDGAVDLADFSCGGSKQHNDEGNPKSQCQDSIDNDGDGAIDRADFSCSGNQDNDESDPQSKCQDGVDNDQDGLVDTLDPGCKDGQDNDESDEPAVITVGVECVYDNQDGFYTAYFSYNNVKDSNIEIPTTSMGATKNELSPGNPNRGQVTVFKPGANKGAFGVIFDGQPLTWSVRAQGGSLSQATASLNSPECKHVEPIAECIDSSVEGLKVTYSYRNLNDFTVTVPLGSLNFFSPSPADRGQPTALKAGLNKGVFSTLFEDDLAWNLDGARAKVTEATPVCPGGCVDTPIGTVKSDLNETALDLAALARKAAKQLSALANKQAKQGKISASMATKLSRDGARAAKKADTLSKRAQSLALAFPEVIKSCPFSPPFCETVDRGETIEALRGLYADIVNQIKRIQARKNFALSGATSRDDKLVIEGKQLNELGNEQLDQLPRVATECA